MVMNIWSQELQAVDLSGQEGMRGLRHILFPSQERYRFLTHRNALNSTHCIDKETGGLIGTKC